jgi:pilus assembly protein FimV
VSAAERTKVLEAAQKHLAKGNYDKAIGEFRKIVDADPNDVRTWLKIGDTYTRKGARDEAIAAYAKVAQQYGDQGFFVKAVAVYKQIIKLDPARLDIQIKLAEIYEMLQHSSDALATYEHVAAGHARAGNIAGALETLAKMTVLDPENIPVRIKYAEALSKAQKTKDAAREFEVGASLLKQQGRMEDFIKVGERLLYHRPDDTKFARELASLYLERSDPKRALSKLQVCFKADAKDTATLELLAEAFNQLGQLPKTISVYREVARLHQEAHRHDDRIRTLRKIIECDPGDAEARQALAAIGTQGSASVRKDIAPPASAVVEPSRSQVRESEAPEVSQEDDAYDEEEIDEDALEEEVEEELEADAEDVESGDVESGDVESGDVESDEVDVIDGDDDLIVVDEEEPEDEQPAAAAAPKKSKAPEPSVPPDVQREAHIARLLTECDVFMRYGLRTKVVEQLHAVLEIEPMHVEARERLKDVHLRMGQTAEAIAELLTLADILAEEESAAATLYLREILELDPSHADARLRLERMSALRKSLRPSAPQPVAEPQTPLEAPAPEPSEEAAEAVAEEAAALEPAMPEDAAEVRPHDQITRQIPLDEVAEAEEELLTELEDEDVEEAEPVTRAALVPPPSREMRLVPKPAQLDDEPDDLLAPMSPREFDEVPLRPSTPGVPAPPSVRQSLQAGDVEEVLDEAEFFVAQGLYEEARGVLADSLSHHPGNVLLEEKLREVSQHLASAASARAAAGADQSFELAERLAEELDGAPPDEEEGDMLDVEQVFAQFKKGVEQQVGIEDTETHFDLGIAYKEMGLLDDAMNEFRLCVNNPARVCIAETMIGLCLIEKGEVAEAIVHFKKGLYADAKNEREELGLYFELGHAYDLLHDAKEALYYFQKVQKRDPSFRDVAKRIQKIAQPQAAQAKGTTPMNPDDIDRAFDDLVGED